jgi:hypothetical protein
MARRQVARRCALDGGSEGRCLEIEGEPHILGADEMEAFHRCSIIGPAVSTALLSR